MEFHCIYKSFGRSCSLNHVETFSPWTWGILLFWGIESRTSCTLSKHSITVALPLSYTHSPPIYLELLCFLSKMVYSFRMWALYFLAKFISKYVVIFTIIGSGIMFLISLLDCLLQVHWNIIDFLYISLVSCNFSELMF